MSNLEDGRRDPGRHGDRRIFVFSNRSLETDASRIFDRTFAITYALEAVAIFVAVMGIAGALLALVIDRRREFGLFRFLGASTQQVRKLILIEAGLLGLLANIAGLALGFVLSLLLDLRHQQAVVRLDDPVSLARARADCGAHVCLCRHCSGRSLSRAGRYAVEPHRGCT